VEEANKLRDELPPDVQATLLRHEEAGTTTSQEYVDAMQVFYDRHVCRRLPYPDYMKRSFDFLGQAPEVYNTMNGPSEFHVVGTIKNWDVRHRLGEIQAPTLVTSGRYDEATPVIAGTVHEGIPGSKWVIFEESSHSAHVEEEDLYRQVLTDFISQYDDAAQ
jgi:proline-specific peptidase